MGVAQHIEPQGSASLRLNRRQLLAGAVGVATAVCVAGHGSPAAAASPFTIWNAVLGNPDLSSYGVPRLSMVYQGELATDGEPDETKTKTAIANRVSNGISRACLDIETWPINGVPDNEFAASAAKYNQVADWVHEQAPTFRAGWYGILPRRNYWAPVQSNPDSLQAWYDENARRQVIAAHVEDIYPSLYTFYADQSGWVTYANANMTQAGIYAKPAYVFLWPKFHGSAPPDIRGTYIPVDYWRLQLETVLAHHNTAGSTTAGIVLWNNDSPWDPTAAWWTETVDFINDHNLG